MWIQLRKSKTCLGAKEKNKKKIEEEEEDQLHMNFFFH